jgi:hypothetical protein
MHPAGCWSRRCEAFCGHRSSPGAQQPTEPPWPGKNICAPGGRGPIDHPSGHAATIAGLTPADRAWNSTPPGPLARVCPWPAAGIALTGHELDAQLIIAAAARAQVVSGDGRQEVSW